MFGLCDFFNIICGGIVDGPELNCILRGVVILGRTFC